MFVKRSRLLLIVLLAVALLAVGSAAERSVRTITVSGTGFVVGADGYLLTNEHVIHGATSIKVVVGGQDYSAEVKEAREDRDLALLKISGYGLPTVALGDSDTVEIGDQVVAIGCPEGICGTVTQGRVANLGVDATFGDKTLHNLIMIDVTITHGSSGGPLLNMKGEVIGITMGGIEGTSFGFAIPINDAISLLDEVPGFSRSQMGQATEELSLSEIVDRVRPMTVYVEVESEIPLSRLLLPEEQFESITGCGVEVSSGDCSTSWAERWPWSEYYSGVEGTTGLSTTGLAVSYCLGIWDVETADGASQIQSTMHSRFASEYESQENITYGVPKCSAGFLASLAGGRLDNLTQRTGSLAGYQFRFSLITSGKWVWVCDDICEESDYQQCEEQGTPDKIVAESGLVTWTIQDLLFIVVYDAVLFESSPEEVTQTLMAITQAAIAHAINVLQNP